MIPPASPLPPLVIFGVLAAADVALLLWRRLRRSPAWWTRLAPSALRPLAALALCNALYRLRPATFKFNVLSFPLWGNAWPESLAAGGGQIPRTLAAAAGIAAVLVLLRRALSAKTGAAPWLPLLWAALLAAQIAIVLAPRGWEGAAYPWSVRGKVYAWDARRVDPLGGAAAFIGRYDEVQPRQSVHARSHPPGATLLSWWTMNTERPEDRGNLVRSLLLQSLNIPVLYLLGTAILGARAGLAAAALCAAMPAATAFGGYSQDTFYAVLFNLYLLLSWEIARRERALPAGVAAGVVLFAISMLTFSWSIVAAAGFAFVAISRHLRGSPPMRTIEALALPPLVLGSLHLLTAAGTGFDYLAAYRESYAFHVRFYPFAGAADWIKAFVGGQLEFLWGVGPLVAGLFLSVLANEAIRERTRPFFVLCWSVLACYGIAIVFGPNPLKLETARCWYWVATVAVLAAAGRLAPADGGDDRAVLLAVAASFATALISVSIFNFGA